MKGAASTFTNDAKSHTTIVTRLKDGWFVVNINNCWTSGGGGTAIHSSYIPGNLESSAVDFASSNQKELL